ncbi:MAG: APC family permease [Rhizomicrobium sp.]
MAEAQERGHLLKILGVTFGVAVAIGGMIGAGILRTPSSIAALVPDADLIVALWMFGALQAALEANVFAELGTAMPRAGGMYVYAHRAFGDIGGLAVGWTLWSARLCSAAALSVAFADFLALIWPVAGAHTTLVALGMLAAVFGLNAIGLREGRSVQEFTSLAKALALAAFCIVAFLTAAPATASVPAVAVPAMAAPAIGLMGVVGAYQMIVGAYAGWYEPLFFAEENADPSRSVPRAMFIGIAIGAVLYVAVNLGLIHALGVGGMAHGALPYTTILSRALGPAAATLFAIGAMFVVSSCTNAGVMSAPRVLLGLARDRLLPGALADVNRGGSPWVAVLMTAAGAVLLTLTGVFNLLFGLIGTLGVAAQLLTVVAIFVLRRREPDMPRPWRAFGYPFLPALVLVVDMALLLLFLASDWRGAAIAAALWAACIPFAWVARRAVAA